MIRRIALVSGLSSLGLIVGGGQVAASVTIGQLAPGNPPPATCIVSPYDEISVAVGSGNSYVMPATGVVTSWTTNAGSAPGQQLKMKVFRRVSGDTWMAIGHDGPRNLTPSGTDGNTFPTNVPVKAGDVLGLNDANASAGTPNACVFALPGSSLFESETTSDLADGQQGNFVGPSDSATNVSATLVPDNTLRVGAVVRNKKKGTATLTVNVPNPGELSGSGNGATVASARAVTSKSVPAGPAQLRIKAKGKKKRMLNETGRVKLSVAITYRPTGGDPNTESVKVKLKKKL
jgi:hypothetical protein